MIKFEFFTYTDAQWDEIKDSRAATILAVDADQIERQVTPTLRQVQHHRDAVAAGPHRDHGEPVSSAQCRQPSQSAPRKLEHPTQRTPRTCTPASSMRSACRSTAGSTASSWTRCCSTASMPTCWIATSDYFRKLAANLDRQIEQAGSARRQRTQDRPRPVLERAAGDLVRTWRQTEWQGGGALPVGRVEAVDGRSQERDGREVA